MSLERRLAALEASRSPRAASGARGRLASKLGTVAQAHLTRRSRGGGEPVLEGQSMASLLGLVLSYPRGSVPHEVAQAASLKAQEMRSTTRTAATKLVRSSLVSKGYDRGL
jgi:hypothetical protein